MRKRAKLFVKIDHDFPRHPKVIGLSAAAKWLFVEGLCYAATYQTDGYIPSVVVRELGGRPSAVDALVGVNLWERLEHGFQIHDYTEHQQSKEAIESKQRDKSIAGAIGAASRWHNSGDSKPMHRRKKEEERIQNTEAAAVAAAPPPEPLTRCIRAYDGLMGTLATTPPILQRIESWHSEGVWAYPDQPSEWFEAACAEAAESNVKSLKYVLAILERWKREGFKHDGRSNGARVGADTFISGLGVKVGKEFDFGPPRTVAAGEAEGSVGEVRAERSPNGRESDS